MTYNKKNIEDIQVSGKKVLVRCDFNVPLKDGVITSDKRIVEAIPTIKYLLDQGAAVILCSHMGKPKGEVNPKYTLAPVAARLTELLGQEVKLAPDTIGEETKAMAAALECGQALLLENTRFDKREEKNDPEFAKELASMAEIFVNDAFGAAHRAHASTAGVADYLPAVCGYLIQKEIGVMGKALEDPARPFVAILGGAKVSDKIGVINNLIEKCDTIIIGGGMAYTFFRAAGCTVGTSLCEDDKMDLALSLIAKAKEKGVKFLLPVDNKCATEFDNDAPSANFATGEIPENYMGMDIGPATAEMYARIIESARTVVWNGPAGVFEMPNFAHGTETIAEAVAKVRGVSIIGGGDSAAAIAKMGYSRYVTHISTGGGASLNFLQGNVLPGIACLDDKE